MRQLTLVVPFPKIFNKRSGLSIRLAELEKYFLQRGVNVKQILTERDLLKLNNTTFTLLFLSSKKGSLSYQALKRLRDHKKNRIIIDGYTPLLLEKQHSESFLKPINLYRQKSIILSFIKRADYLLTANKRQKSYWKQFCNRDKIRQPAIFSLPTKDGKEVFPVDKKQLYKKNILWFGGIYPWFDPWPLIKALPTVFERFYDGKFIILGGYQKGTGYKDRYDAFVSEVRNSIGDHLELIDWLPKEELTEILRKVSLAVHLVSKSDEDYYAHRVRLITLLKNRIPIITNGDDIISHYAFEKKAAVVVKGNQTRFLAKAIINIMSDEEKMMLMAKNGPITVKKYMKEESEEEILFKELNI